MSHLIETNLPAFLTPSVESPSLNTLPTLFTIYEVFARGTLSLQNKLLSTLVTTLLSSPIGANSGILPSLLSLLNTNPTQLGLMLDNGLNYSVLLGLERHVLNFNIILQEAGLTINLDWLSLRYAHDFFYAVSHPFNTLRISHLPTPTPLTDLPSDLLHIYQTLKSAYQTREFEDALAL
jgi:hypothetical protein